jgi:N,N'-diacetyllegionaminate synthase
MCFTRSLLRRGYYLIMDICSKNESVMIVAEVGNNHEGNFEVAEQMVYKAAECGVDAVKFQTFKTEHYVAQSDTDRFKRLKQFEMGVDRMTLLSELAHSLGLMFISTPFDLHSADELEDIVDAYKISSSDNTFYPLLSVVASKDKPILLSTGLSDMDTVNKAVACVESARRVGKFHNNLALLHCVSSYPTPPEEANLKSIGVLAKSYEYPIGYSDHTTGIDACVLATALGAVIVEKHFTLDKHYSDFRDHQLSADPEEMQMMVKSIRDAERMLGKNEKHVMQCEKQACDSMRRSIVAATQMKQGHRIRMEDITWVRPAGGVPPGNEELLIGKTLKRDINYNEKIVESDVE